MNAQPKSFMEVIGQRDNVVALPERKNQCSKCGITKSISDFYKVSGKNAHKNGGYSYDCKECIKSYAKEHRGVLNPELASNRRKRHWEKLTSDPERIIKHRRMKNAWNRSEKYYQAYYKRRFGISLEQVQKMLMAQNGLCANIGCSRPINLGNQEIKATFAVDHNHETGRVRGLLCIRCNCMLGHIEKNRSLVPGMMNYLNQHG